MSREAAPKGGAEDLFQRAPCGYLCTRTDGTVVTVNDTLLSWLGRRRADLVGRAHFTDLLTVGGRIYHETHFAPLLRLQGEVSGIALELRTAAGGRLPVLVSSALSPADGDGPELVRTALLAARDRRAYETELLHARREAERERERLERLAGTLQRVLLPPALPPVPGLEVAAHYHVASADEVGGDFYDLFPLPGERWAAVMGDVSGKGAPAAALTSLLRHTVRAATLYDPDPVAVLSHANTVLATEQREEDEPRFCTAVYGLLRPERTAQRTARGCTVTLASGGHPPAVLLRARGGAGFVPTPGGQLIGALPSADIAVTTAHLAPGDTLLLYTDGLIEARSGNRPGAARYDEEALLEFLGGLAPASAAATVTAVTGLLEGFGPGLEDDTALLALGVPL
ncbi:SpoIIE family protein phosphatase [Streptomyces sp. YIM 98790]|uniref:SpoIIE family protein phosphatase n=1 Tax=Streptomyces sp. YIM 98790 TaxID=2689077 RepID=UPI00140CADCB|nr:SpoIIE family protein phosphatase [Streptomyces sp. YIM 98790]